MQTEVEIFESLKAIADQLDFTSAKTFSHARLTPDFHQHLKNLEKENRVLTLYSTPNSNELVSGFHIFGSSPLPDSLTSTGGPFGAQYLSYLATIKPLPEVLLESPPLVMDFYAACSVCKSDHTSGSACSGPSNPPPEFRGDCEEGEILWDFSRLFFR